MRFVALAVLVGLLVVIPLTRRFRRWVPVGLAGAGAVLLVALGTPLWLNLAGARTVHFPPRWHVAKANTARAILAHYDGDRPILAEKTVMLALAIVAAEPKAVNARTHYLENTRLSPEQMAARITLTEWIMARQPNPNEKVRSALDYLDVGLICVDNDRPGAIAAVQRLGPFERRFFAGGEVCVERLPAGS